VSTEQYRQAYERALQEKAREERDSGCAESMVKFPGRALKEGLREAFSSEDSNKGHRDARMGKPFDPGKK
jgi:hypothetical protein